MAAFERSYLRIVGRGIAKLDEIDALILAALARTTDDPKIAQRAREARERAEQFHASSAASAEPDISTPPSDDLQQLYRQMTRLMHPNLAPDENSGAARTEMMARCRDRSS